jgi:signal transduction histidine kinase
VLFTFSVKKLMHVDDHESEFKKYLSIEVSKFKSIFENIEDLNRYKTIFLTRAYKKDSLIYHNDILDASESFELYHVESFNLDDYVIKLNLLHSTRNGFVNSSGNPIILNDYKYQYKKNEKIPGRGLRINKIHIHSIFHSILAFTSFIFFYIILLESLPKIVNRFINQKSYIDLLTIFVIWTFIRFGIEELDLNYRIDPKFKIYLALISDIVTLFYVLFKANLIRFLHQFIKSEQLTLSIFGTLFIYFMYQYVNYYIEQLSYNFDINHGLQLPVEQFLFLILMMILSAFLFLAINRGIEDDNKEISFYKKLSYLFAAPIIAGLVFSFIIPKSVVIILTLFILLLILSFDIYRGVDEKRLAYYVWWIVFQAVFISFVLYQPSKAIALQKFEKLIETSFYKAVPSDVNKVSNLSDDLLAKGLITTLFSVTESEIPEVTDIKKFLYSKALTTDYNFLTIESVDIFYRGKPLVKDGLYDYNTLRQNLRKGHEVAKNVYYLPITPHFTLHFIGENKNEIFISLKVKNYAATTLPFQITRNNEEIFRNNLTILGIGGGEISSRIKKQIIDLDNQYYAHIYSIEKGFIGPISLFTLIFAFGVIGVLLLIVLNNKYHIIPTKRKSIKFADSSSLSFRIQVTIVGLSVIIFTVIGIMTTIYLNRMSAQESAQKSRVSTDLLIKYINEELGNNDDFNSIRNYLSQQTNRFGELFDGYIDLFDYKGYNLKSSRSAEEYVPNLPQKEITKMHSYLGKLNQGKFSSYQATDKYNIIEIKSPQQTQSLYLGYSPAILRFSNVEKEYVRTYIGTMLNVYIFLFLLATAIAIAISNTVTNPLTILKNNLRSYKFGKTHPKLEWASNDEIGELINEYNLLTDEITKSADLLAKTEREMAWREMAKQVAHEIKNPLTPMKLSLQYLERAINDDPERAKGLIPKISNTLMEQINNLTQIADSFSNFATLPKTTNEKIILNEVVEAIHDLFRKREDMDIEMLEPVNDIHVLADRNHLVRILNNVVKNATQAIPEEKRGRIEIELTKKENKAVIRVSDNGTGITEAMKPKVFTPNFTSKSSGTGLGLAICANMLESMNGRIYFESQEGVGTDFFIELPLIKDEVVEEGQEVVVLE